MPTILAQQEYLSRQAKDYLEPEEIVECEKYRIKRDYGMACYRRVS